MEDLSEKKQSSPSFVLFSLKPGGLKFFLFFALGLVVLVLVGEGVYYFKLKDKEEKPVELDVSTGLFPAPSGLAGQPAAVVEPDMAGLPVGLTLALPVEEEYLEKALLDKKYSQVLSFFLPAQASIKAVFSGEVTKVLRDQKPFPNDLAFREVRLEREDKNFWASYVIVGEVLVQEGQKVEEGEVLARAGEGGLSFRSGTNLSLWLHNRDNRMIKLSKEIFK
jgi:hypothetical protein